MSDLINRQDIRYESMLRPLGNGNYEECEVAYRDEIEAMPSVERTGRWTHVYDENAPMLFKDRWICSACGKSNLYGMSDFCPECGAMMENSTRRMKEARNGEQK